MNSKILGFFGQNRWLSNFFPANVEHEDIIYPSVENAYQAAKFPKEDRQVFVNYTASQAKLYGKSAVLSQDWHDKKIDLMRYLVKQKFSEKNPELLSKLIATGDSYIEETNGWGDTFWGVCRGVGENHLGKIIMEVRNEHKS